MCWSLLDDWTYCARVLFEEGGGDHQDEGRRQF